MKDSAPTILTVNTADAGGGAERVARELHESYAEAGADAWFATGVRRSTAPQVVEIPNLQHRSAWARAMHHLAATIPPRGIGFRAARFLRDVIAEPSRGAHRRRGFEDFDFPGTPSLLDLTPRRPDVLHLHNLHGGYFDLRALPALSAQVPTIISLHDAWLLSGHCAHSFECGRWESGCGFCPALWIYPAVPRDETAFNWARKREILARSALWVGVPCKWMAERVQRSMLAPSVRGLKVIPYGVDLGFFRAEDKATARVALGLDSTRLVMLTTATSLRSQTWRDSDAFRGALERLGTEAAGAQWIALGESGPDEQVGQVTVRHVAFESDERRLVQWYQAADAYVHPARADTFPLMILEALACGTPVIASAVGGIPEQILAAETDGAIGSVLDPRQATGLLAAPGDAQSLARAIDWFAALDAAARAVMSANAVRDATARFDRKRHAREYLEWMRALIAGHVDE